MAVAVTFLEQDKQAPAQIAGQLAEFLNAAKTSLHIAIYDFRLSDVTAGAVVNALRSRAAAGVDVRIVYDAGKLQVGFPESGADPAPPGTADFVHRIGDKVQSTRITGGDPKIPKLMHHKYIIRDGKTPAAAVWTGSTNFTDDSWSLQENNIVRIDSPELCAYYETDFSELWDKGDIATTGAHDVGTVSVGGTQIKVAFSPGEGRSIDLDVAHLIRSARNRLKMGSMLITSGGILGALSDVLQKGHLAEFGGIYDETQMASVVEQWKTGPSAWKIPVFQDVAAKLAGKRSTPYTPTSKHDFMHNKVVVADDAVVTGSYNLSHSATENAENILVIHDRELADRYVAYIDGLVKRYKGQE
jgi:phosphatidylserine/phosphatidylglycerophosphate/cardiolipin synthase-like enzyme